MWPIVRVLLAAGVVGGIVSVVRKSARARALVPKPMEPFSEDAKLADLQLYDELVRIAQEDPESTVRDRASQGAAGFKKLWLDPGHAGYNIDGTFHEPIYGRYCGAGYTGTGEPVDAIDRACKRHDEARAAAFE